MASNKVVRIPETPKDAAHKFGSQKPSASDCFPVRAMSTLSLREYSRSEPAASKASLESLIPSPLASLDGTLSSSPLASPESPTSSSPLASRSYRPILYPKSRKSCNPPGSQPEIGYFSISRPRPVYDHPIRGRDPNYVPAIYVAENENCPKLAMMPGTAAFYKRKRLERKLKRENPEAAADFNYVPETKKQKQTDKAAGGKAKMHDEEPSSGAQSRYNTRQQRAKVNYNAGLEFNGSSAESSAMDAMLD